MSEQDYLLQQAELRRVQEETARATQSISNLSGGPGVNPSRSEGGNLVPQPFEHQAALSLVNNQIALMKEQLNAQKLLQRESKIASEKAKHSEPQIKRAMEKLFTFLYKVEDCSEELDQISALPVCADNADIFYNSLNSVSQLLVSLRSEIFTEIQMSKMASASPYKWLTVKQFETDTIFHGEKAEELTKKYRSAEFAAARVLRTMRGSRGGGRVGGRFSGRSTRWSDPSPRPTTHTHNSGDSTQNNLSQLLALAGSLNFNRPKHNSSFSGICYNCGQPGHIAGKCTNPKKQN